MEAYDELVQALKAAIRTVGCWVNAPNEKTAAEMQVELDRVKDLINEVSGIE